MSRLNERRNIVGRNARERLETPNSVGYRPGMTSYSMIGRKLGSLYELPADRKREIETALETLDDKLR